MPVKFSWDSAYSVGDELIDSQHQHLFSLANTLGRDIQEQKVREVVKELYKYTQFHFSTEEQLMRSMAYPLLEEHCTLHEDLVSELNELSQQDLSSQESVSTIQKFVFNWLVNHILQEDMRYASHIRNN